MALVRLWVTLVIVRVAVVKLRVAVRKFRMAVRQKLNYMYENPVSAGIVYEIWHYKYSSEIGYCTNLKGKIDLELV